MKGLKSLWLNKIIKAFALSTTIKCLNIIRKQSLPNAPNEIIHHVTPVELCATKALWRVSPSYCKVLHVDRPPNRRFHFALFKRNVCAMVAQNFHQPFVVVRMARADTSIFRIPAHSLVVKVMRSL